MKRLEKTAGARGTTRGAMRMLASGLLMALLAACSLDPAYKRPDMNIPSAFKEAPQADATAASGAQGQWKPAQPSDALSRGEWWTVFGDDMLNQLEQQALEANQDLKAAAARVLKSTRASGRRARSCRRPRKACRKMPTCRR